MAEWPKAARTIPSSEAVERTLGASYADPEGLYLLGRALAYFGESERALTVLGRAVDGGFCCAPAMARDAWLDQLRTQPGFGPLMRRAEERRREALTLFLQAAGDRLLAINM